MVQNKDHTDISWPTESESRIIVPVKRCHLQLSWTNTKQYYQVISLFDDETLSDMQLQWNTKQGLTQTVLMVVIFYKAPQMTWRNVV